MAGRRRGKALGEVRARVAISTVARIKAHATVRGIDEQEVVREILDAWAEERDHENSLAEAYERARGIERESEGTRGNWRR